MDQQSAYPENIRCLKHSERCIPEQRTPITFPMQTMIEGEAPEDRHRDRIGHIAPEATEGLADHDTTRGKGIIANYVISVAQHISP